MYEYTDQFTPVKWENIKISLEECIPQQQNGIDCGIFVCEYAENLARGSKFLFNQEDTYFIRERIKTEIVLTTLIQDPFNI